LSLCRNIYVSKLDYRRRKKSGQKIYKNNTNTTKIIHQSMVMGFETASPRRASRKPKTRKTLPKKDKRTRFSVCNCNGHGMHTKKKQQTVSLSSSVFKTQTFVWWDFYAMVGMFALFSQGARSTSSPTSYSTSIGFQVVELPTARKSV